MSHPSGTAVTVVCLRAGTQIPEHAACAGQPFPPSAEPSRFCKQQPLLLHYFHRPSLLLVQARHKPNRDCLIASGLEMSQVLKKTQQAQLKLEQPEASL